LTLFITIVHLITCLLLVSVVLLQHGRGADVGAAFGSGASQTVFGAAGAGNFLTRLTTGAAIVFMITSLALSYFSHPPTISELLEEEATAEAVAPPEVEVPEAIPTETAPIGGLEERASETPSGFEAIPLPESQTETAPPSESPQ
jgi:preprotein translocase subunit SecG